MSTTHRSLNKLERRAHQNMHVLVEIPDVAETFEPNTRDRFGKYHALPKKENPDKK